jgi:hypothetical protein
MTISVYNKSPLLDNYSYTDGAAECENLAEIITSRCWCPAVFVWGYRAKSNFVFADFIGLDFDDGPSLAEITRSFADMECIIGITKSHQLPKGSKPPCDRFRVVLKLEHRCENLRDFEHTTKRLIKQYDADKSASDGARFFRPCREVTFNTLGEADLYTQEILIAPEYRPPVVVKPSSGKYYKSPLFRAAEAATTITNRNETLFIIGMDLKRQGLNPDEIFAIIDRITPTIENHPNKDMNFSMREKRSILSSIIRSPIQNLP